MGGCAAVGCTNRGEKGFKLHIFPKDKQRRQQWTMNVQRKGWEPTVHSALCEVHFDDSQYEANRADGWRKLKWNAVPTLFNNTNPPPAKITPLKQKTKNQIEGSRPTSSTRGDLDSPVSAETPHTVLSDKGKKVTTKIRKPSHRKKLVRPKGYRRKYDEARKKRILENGTENGSPETNSEKNTRFGGNHNTMPRSCCVVMCGHSFKYCKMKRFPSDPVRAAVWQNNVGRPDWERSESSCVCECHFDASQFEQNRQDGLKKLRHDAVPLIFPTHVLAVYDPTGEKKWHTPEPQPRPPPLPVRIQRKFSKPVKRKSQICEVDHMYAKDSTDEDVNENSVMRDSFSQDEVLEDPEKNVLSPRANKMAQNGFSSEKSTPNLSTERSVRTRKRSNPSREPQVSPAYLPKLSQSQNKEQATQASTVVETLRKTVSLNSKQSKHSPSKLLVTSEGPVEKQSPPCKRQKTSQASRKISELSSGADSAELFESPKVWDSQDVNGSTVDSPELLKDALSFLQFMLPKNWIAFPENCGIHVALLSKSKAKSIQRSVFVPFNGNKIELYVHAAKLSKDHEIFDCAIFNETESLTHDSLGSFVDRIVNIVQLFSSHEICCGATDKEYLLVWRKFNDCILDTNFFGEEKYSQTVRSVSCSLLSPKDGVRCKMCDTLYD